MFETLFSSVFRDGAPAWEGFLISLAAAFLIGVLLAFSYSKRASCSGSFFSALSVLPAAVCLVIFAVNGNLGVGVAVAGAFSLVRFRSAPGNGREICAIFVGMGIGLMCGLGYIGYGVLFAVLSEALLFFYARIHLDKKGDAMRARDLRITVPENLNYADLFEDLFRSYTESHRLMRVKTTNMGSLYKLYYQISLKNPGKEKEMIDKLRTRNGNLEISCAVQATEDTEL